MSIEEEKAGTVKVLEVYAEDIQLVENDALYSLDYIQEHGCPSQGCRFEVCINKEKVNSIILLPDAASWEIKELNVMQDSFSHGGFQGTISNLLSKLHKDIEMVRYGYAENLQSSFDAFLSKILRIQQNRFGEDDDIMISFVIHDISGITKVISNTFDHSTDWFQKNCFDRTFHQNEALGLIPDNYSETGERNDNKTIHDIAQLVHGCKNIVVISGAGISVESGISPFRSGGKYCTSTSASTPSSLAGDTAAPSPPTYRDGSDTTNSANTNSNNMTNINNITNTIGDSGDCKGEVTPVKPVDLHYVSDPDGDESIIWNKFDATRMTLQNFNSQTNDMQSVKEWWEMKRVIIPQITCAQPNPAHLFFGYLHEQNKLLSVITQNIDSLHQKGGVPNHKVIDRTVPNLALYLLL